MPKPKNKKTAFIDKKHAVSFHLVHRSQQVTITIISTSLILSLSGSSGCG